MKKHILLAASTLAFSSLVAADSSSLKDEVTNAANKLGSQQNYTWRTTYVVPEDAPWKPGPVDGKVEKEGFTWFSLALFYNSMEAVAKGKQGAVKLQDGWKSLEEIDKEEGFARFPAMIVRNLRVPAREAAELAGFAKELKKEGEVICGELTEQGAKTMQTFRVSEGEGPTVSDAKGSVKFWVKDGALTKYEFKLKGNISFNGNDMPNDRTTTVEIRDVGKTKIEVPEAARKKISG